MKKQQVFSQPAIRLLSALTIISTMVTAQPDQMSNPKGAIGNGVVKGRHAQSNKFWWPEQLDLAVSEMTVFLGGLHVLNAQYQGNKDGVFKGINRDTNQFIWQATSVDLIFGLNSALKAVSGVYAFDN